MSTAPTTRVDDPYVGPVAFGSGDPLYGRDRERDELLDLLIAERIVLLYSPSGAGKSSLIEAALVPALREANFEVLPTIRVTHTLPPESGMPTPANRYVMSVLLSLEEGVPREKQRPVETLARMTLREYLESFADRDGRPGNEVLIFDQFEEILTTDPTDEAVKQVFFEQLGQVLRDRGHWALLSMREEFRAALDPYLRYLPTRLRTTYRLDLLSVPQALEAIRRPAQRAGVDFTQDAARGLVDDLRGGVRAQGSDGVEEVLGSYVEPVQLQVACHLLWSKLPPDATEIFGEDVAALGRVDQALGEYYAERVAAAAMHSHVPERIIRDWFEDRLITPQGWRNQVLQGPASAPKESPVLLAELMDAHLLRAETRRQAIWYELAHDRLIDPVRRDNAAWRESHLSPLERAALVWEREGKPDRLLFVGADLAAAEQHAVERQDASDPREREFLDASRRADAQARKDVETARALKRSARRLRVTAIAMSILAVVSLVLFGTSLVTSQQAAMQSQRAASSEETTRLLLGLQESMETDEYIGTAMAAEVAGRMDRDLAREVLYSAAQSPVERVFRGQTGPIGSAAFSADGTTLATAGPEDIQLWDWQTAEAGERLRLDDGEVASTVDISADGRTVVAALESGMLILWRVDGGEPVRWATGSSWLWSVDLSPDGTRIASAGYSTDVEIWQVEASGDAAPTLERTLTVPEAFYVNIAVFTSDGDRIAVSSDLPEVRIWDVGSGLEADRLQLPGDGGGAWNMWFAEGDDSRLATMTGESVTVWNLPVKEAVYEPLSLMPYTGYNMSDDLSRVLETQTSGTLSVIDLASGEKTAGASARGGNLCCAGFGPHGEDTALVLRNATGAPSVWRLDPHTEKTSSVTAATVVDGVVVSAWDDGMLRRWEPGEDAVESDYWATGAIGNLESLTSDEEGDRLVGVTEYSDVVVWDGLLRPQTYDYEKVGFPTEAALLPDGGDLVLGDADGRVGLFDVDTGDDLGRELVAADGRPVTAVDVAADGSRIVATFAPAEGSGRTAVGPGPVAAVASVSGDDEVLFLGLPPDQTGTEATAVGFSADGRRILVGTSGGAIVTYDSSTGDHVETVQAHHHAVRDIVHAGTASGSILTTGGSSESTLDRVVLVSEDGARTIPSRDDLIAATISADGESVVMFTADGVARTLPIDDDELDDLVDSKVAYDLTPDVCRSYGVSGC